MPATLLSSLIDTVPTPADIRQMIGIRTAEVGLLRRLLRVAGIRDRMLPADLIRDAAEHGHHRSEGSNAHFSGGAKGVTSD